GNGGGQRASSSARPIPAPPRAPIWNATAQSALCVGGASTPSGAQRSLRRPAQLGHAYARLMLDRPKSRRIGTLPCRTPATQDRIPGDRQQAPTRPATKTALLRPTTAAARAAATAVVCARARPAPTPDPPSFLGDFASRSGTPALLF
ncbi:unnamed protein product, partial [Prorocentrum cordatum]